MNSVRKSNKPKQASKGLCNRTVLKDFTVSLLCALASVLICSFAPFVRVEQRGRKGTVDSAWELGVHAAAEGGSVEDAGRHREGAVAEIGIVEFHAEDS